MKKRCVSFCLTLALLLSFFAPLITVEANATATRYWPVPGHTSLSRGYTADHRALDIHDASINGATVVAAMGGTVYRIFKCTQQHYGSNHDCNGFGTGLVIKGDDGWYYQYAHMQANSIPSNVYSGAYVQAGQQLGKVGTTGNSSGPHLHFSIASNSTWWEPDINPGNLSYSGQSAAVTMSWVNHTQESKVGDFYTYVDAVANVSGVFTEAGITVFNPHNGNEIVAQKIEATTNSVISKLQIWYNILEETGVNLTPGSNLAYQFHVKFGGTYYYSPVYTIDVQGSHTHVYQNWETTEEATCAKEGVETGHCKWCAATDTRSIEKKAHNYSSSVVAPTCTKDGYTSHVCTVCSNSYTDNAVAATGHNWTPATCTAAKTCSVCKTTEGKALGHDMGAWVTTKEPTANADGEKTRTCNRGCGYQETEKQTGGWIKANGKWYYYQNGQKLKSQWLKSGSKWYYLGADGVMATGWVKVDGKWYLMNSSGAMLSGWQKVSDKWYYLNNDMKTGWVQVSGKWYYMNSSGVMQTGWEQVGGKWYYLSSDGAMRTGWQKIDGTWYYLKNEMKTGWQKVGANWYYLGTDGVMQTGWVKLSGKWYYLDSSGAMATGTKVIGGKTYKFNSNGVWIA